MSKINRVIVATDLSGDARPAAQWAQGFGAAQGAEVTVLHVIEVSAAHWLEGAYDYLDDPELQKKAQDHVRQWYSEATGAEPAAVDVRVGTAAVQIREAVEECGADLLVVARSGKRGWQRFLLGSTARSLAIDPPCELVLVHPEHATPELRDIVVGTDFSRNADRAVRTACELARANGAKLHIVHSDDLDEVGTIDALGGAAIPAEYRRTDVELDAGERMKALEKTHAEALSGLDYDTHLGHQAPGQALLDHCESNGSDLLVVGRAGHSPLVTKILGSVINRVEHASPATLVICPPE